MRNPLSEKIVTIPPSGIRKFFDIVSEMKDAISLGVGEPDFDTPWHIREEGIYSLEKGRTFYTANSGLRDLRVEIHNYQKRKYDVEYDPDREIMVTVGGSEAIDIALRAMLDPGDQVLVPQPSFVSYVPCAVLAGGEAVPIELEEKDDSEEPGTLVAEHKDLEAAEQTISFGEPEEEIPKEDVPVEEKSRPEEPSDILEPSGGPEIVKTGDNNSLMHLVILMIISCVSIFTCVRIARRD